MMLVKKMQYPKITDEILTISTDIKICAIKMKNQMKGKVKIINKHAKIINGTKKSTKNCMQKILSVEIS